MMTPQKIQDLADPIESIYIAMTNELLVNIGKHVSSPTWTHTAAWEIQKLSELGQLTAENAAIINKYIKAMPAEIRDTMEQTRREALDQIEKQLDKAAKKGYVTPPERDSTVDVLAEYSQQAANKLNLVNTTMLQSSVEQYERLVALTDAEYLRLMSQREATQEILNQAAGNVAVGTETRKTALQRAIRRISEEGLTGFYDKAGRSWSPEAYVNMDIRTTVHNVAIQSVKNRMADYNTSVFQVSAHAGARPLCYPYQGKLYSWDNTEGDIEIGTGATMHYKPINSTSYGQPAGLFGINCGHSPIPVIPGVTIPHAQDYVQPKEENDKAYQESQEQRALEREIRAAKRAVEMGDDSKEAKDRVKEAQAAMRQFIDRTGRTRRYDRESLYGGKPAEKTEKTEKVNSQLTTNAGNNDNNVVKEFTFSKAKSYTMDDLTQTEEKAFQFGDGSWGGVRKTATATVYETPEGTRFVFPKSYNKAHLTLTPELLLEAYNRVPQEIRSKGQKLIIVQDVYNPQDAYWRKQYKNFSHSYATGGDDITFWRYDYWHDLDYLVKTLSHEMGHHIDYTVKVPQGESRTSESKEWLNAMAADLATSGKKSPTTYGENRSTEDFAESVAEMAKDLQQFKTTFPERFALLEEILK